MPDLSIKVGQFFDHSAPAADLFRAKVLLGEIIVIGMDPSHGAVEDAGAVFFESLNTR